jgi:PPM family protein phosphatase
MGLNLLQQNLLNWFMRRTTSSAVRRVADLPMAIATDMGLVRKENQDRAAILRVQLTGDMPTIIAVVCDGMGGMADGAVCSSLAISTFLSGYIQNINLPLKDRIVSSVIQANDAVFAKYSGSGGSTLSAFVIDNQESILGVNVGDSRIYSMDDHKLLQLTVDDTLAGQFAKNNEDLFRGNELLQYIGMGQGIEPHIISSAEGSKLSNILLTSDGVHFLDKRTMELVTKNASDSALAVRRLIELAKWCGGHDNASAIIANLSAMVPERTNLNVGEIEVWDAFGELRLIHAQNLNPNIQKHKSTLEIKASFDQKAETTMESDSTPRNRKRSQPASKAKEKKVKKSENEQTEAKITPQLQIDFDNK